MAEPDLIPQPGIVLIVDDEPSIRLLLERLVRATSDFHPIAIATGAEGYARLTELGDRVALLLLDLTMEGMDGFAFREKQLQGPAAHVPTVVLSGRQLEAAELARLKPAAALVKPVTLGAFRDCIARHARRPAGAEGQAPPVGRGPGDGPGVHHAALR